MPAFVNGLDHAHKILFGNLDLGIFKTQNVRFLVQTVWACVGPMYPKTRYKYSDIEFQYVQLVDYKQAIS